MIYPGAGAVRSWIAIAVITLAGAAAFAGDWPQHQRDAARTGYTSAEVPPPFRARWIWFGKDFVLRNRDVGGEKWTDDLTSRQGHNYRMPGSVDFSFAGSMQPIVVGGKIFVGDCEGKVYAISLADGSTLWMADNPGGTFWPGAATEKVVAFASLPGYVSGYDVETGRRLWRLDASRAITSAPALVDGTMYVATQGGHVHAIAIADGKEIWKSPHLGAPVQGGLCVYKGRVYTGTEAMEAVALKAEDGSVVARRKLMGQSFRRVWPVAVADRVIFTAVPVICVGSEYVNDPVLAGRPGQSVGYNPDTKPGYPNAKAEEEAVLKWLAGDGRYWEVHFALRAGDLGKDYVIATGVTEGCGTPPNPPAIDGEGRPLLWWASAYGTVIRKCGFGTNFTTDISSFDLKTGRRVMIDNGRHADGQTTETDNLYAMSVGGKYLYLRQNFRGTSCIDLTTSRHNRISAVYRYRDGGGWQSPVNYAQGETRGGGASGDSVRVPRTSATPAGRTAPAIADGKIIFTESFCVTCVETAK